MVLSRSKPIQRRLWSGFSVSSRERIPSVVLGPSKPRLTSLQRFPFYLHCGCRSLCCADCSVQAAQRGKGTHRDTPQPTPTHPSLPPPAPLINPPISRYSPPLLWSMGIISVTCMGSISVSFMERNSLSCIKPLLLLY